MSFITSLLGLDKPKKKQNQDSEIALNQENKGKAQEIQFSTEELKEIVKTLNSIVMPVMGDNATLSERQSYPDHVGLMDIIQSMMIVKPNFEHEYLEAIEFLAKYNPDVSNAVENIALANTSITTYFDDSVGERQKKMMLMEIETLRKNWYQFSKSEYGLVADMITQLAIYGATSTEAIVRNDLNGIGRIVLPSPVNIYHLYDDKTGTYYPVQKIPKNYMPFGGKTVNGQYVLLNPELYQYSTIRRIGESPYGIPPFLSALNSLVIQKDMVENMKKIINKLGLLGFLNVILKKPTQLPNEPNNKYEERVMSKMSENAGRIKTGMKSGFMVSYEGTELDMNNIAANNATGAERLMDMNDRMVISGLKQDPSMMGKNNTTTETFARVILAKLGVQLRAYQETIAPVLAHYDLLHLRLKGYKLKSITHEFDSVMLGDKIKEEEAYGKKIDNVIKLRDENLIDQQTAANMLDFEKPAGDAPKKNQGDQDEDNEKEDKPSGDDSKETKKTDPDNIEENSKGKILCEECGYDCSKEKENGMGWGICPECTSVYLTSMNKFSYTSSCCEHHSNGNHVGNTYSYNKHQQSLGISKEEEELWGAYDSAIKAKYEKTIKKISGMVISGLKTIPTGATQREVITNIMYSLYRKWDSEFINEIQPVVARFVRQAYQTYRSEKKVFGGTNKKIPDATFELRDIRAIEFYKKADNLYLGKFIKDEDTIKRVNKWIAEKYLTEEIPIGRNSDGINMFKKEFSELMIQEDWKIRRIIDTSMNRVRNTAAVSYMEQAGVKRFEILGIGDGLQCEYCASMQGKTFSIETELKKHEVLFSGPPENVIAISPFITDLDMTPSKVKNTSSKQLQTMGIGAPPFHPHCRDTIVADI